jgi:hypothetical protein
MAMYRSIVMADNVIVDTAVVKSADFTASNVQKQSR